MSGDFFNVKIVGMLLLLVLIQLFNSSEAAKCPGENIRLDGQGGSMEPVKPRNQENLNTCYAFAAAEVWDAYRFSHYDKKTRDQELGHYTIPMQGALAYTIAKNKEKGKVVPKSAWTASGTLPISEGGDPAKTLKFYMSNKTCVSTSTTDAFMGMLPGKTRNEKIAYLQTIMNNGETTRKLLASYRSQAAGQSPELCTKLQKKYDQEYQDILKETKTDMTTACTTSSTKMLPSQFEKFITEYLSSAQFSEDTLTNINNALAKSCEKTSAPVNVKVPPKIHSGIGTNDKNNIMKDTKTQASATIHKALSGGFNHPKQPVIISTCGNFLLDGKDSDPIRRKTDGSIDAKALEADVYFGRCKGHAVVAIGRKTEGETCKILIRNTWKKCKSAGYAKDWTCDEQGDDVWVDQDALINNTLNYSFFED